MYYDEFFEKQNHRLNKIAWQRNIKYYHNANNSIEYSINNKAVKQFCSNDYLGYAHRVDLYNTVNTKISQIGSTGSRLITGSHNIYEQLENSIAIWHKKPSALYFGSGYQANLTIISTIMQKGDLIISDKYNHNSIKNGIKLSGVDHYEYNHLNYNDVGYYLEHNHHKYKNKNIIIISDMIFSMDGDMVDLRRLIDIAKQYNIWLYIDEAHSTGIYGSSGQGYIYSQYEQGLISHEEYNNIIIMHTCSKALGLQGAFLTGSNNLIQYLINRGQGYIYTTATSPIIIHLLLEIIHDIQVNASRLQEKLWTNTKILREYLNQRNIKYSGGIDSCIFALLLESNQQAIEYSEKLLNNGIWLQGIRPPTAITPRLRLTINSNHNINDINDLFQGLDGLDFKNY